MDAKLIAEYLVNEEGLNVFAEDIFDLQVAGHLVMCRVATGAYHSENYTIGLLSIIAWVYSKVNQSNGDK